MTPKSMPSLFLFTQFIFFTGSLLSTYRHAFKASIFQKLKRKKDLAYFILSITAKYLDPFKIIVSIPPAPSSTLSIVLSPLQIGVPAPRQGCACPTQGCISLLSILSLALLTFLPYLKTLSWLLPYSTHLALLPLIGHFLPGFFAGFTAAHPLRVHTTALSYSFLGFACYFFYNSLKM